MGAPPKTKLTALKFFTSHQLTGSNGFFLAVKGRHMLTIFPKGLCWCSVMSEFSLLLYLGGSWESLIPWGPQGGQHKGVRELKLPIISD